MQCAIKRKLGETGIFGHTRYKLKKHVNKLQTGNLETHIYKFRESTYKFKGNLETPLTGLKENMGRNSKSKGTYSYKTCTTYRDFEKQKLHMST